MSQLGMTGNVVADVNCEIISWPLPGRTEENYENLSREPAFEPNM
jgi:hypothetical protein